MNIITSFLAGTVAALIALFTQLLLTEIFADNITLLFSATTSATAGLIVILALIEESTKLLVICHKKLWKIPISRAMAHALAIGVGFTFIEILMIYLQSYQYNNFSQSLIAFAGVGLIHALSPIIMVLFLHELHTWSPIIYIPITLVVVMLIHASYNMLISNNPTILSNVPLLIFFTIIIAGTTIAFILRKK